MWCWHFWSDWRLLVMTVAGTRVTQQERHCLRCEKTEVALVCMGDLLATLSNVPDDEPEGRMH